MDHADLSDDTFQSSVVEKWRNDNEPQKDVFHTSDRLTLLQDEYNSFSAELTTKSNQIKTAKIFAEETYGFENESMQQKSRLESIELFKNMNNDKHCPVCSGSIIEFTDIVFHLISKRVFQVDYIFSQSIF